MSAIKPGSLVRLHRNVANLYCEYAIVLEHRKSHKHWIELEFCTLDLSKRWPCSLDWLEAFTDVIA